MQCKPQAQEHPQQEPREGGEDGSVSRNEYQASYISKVVDVVTLWFIYPFEMDNKSGWLIMSY